MIETRANSSPLEVVLGVGGSEPELVSVPDKASTKSAEAGGIPTVGCVIGRILVRLHNFHGRPHRGPCWLKLVGTTAQWSSQAVTALRVPPAR